MRTLILIAAIVLVAIVAVRIGAAVTGGERIPLNMDGNSATVSAQPNGETPEQAATENLSDEQRLLEQQNELDAERRTAPYENAAEQMQKQKNMIVQDKELTKEQIRAPYELELQRIEEEKKILRAQQELDELKQRQATEQIQQAPQIKPAQLGKY